MQGEIAFEDLQDPEAITNWPETLGRDGARTPMPWTSNGNDFGGFSESKPWLPMQDSHIAASVDTQSRDEHSVLSFSRKIIALRRSCPVLRYGDNQHLGDGELLVIDRTYDGQHRRLVVNFGSDALPYSGDFNSEITIGEAPVNGMMPGYSAFLSTLS